MRRTVKSGNGDNLLSMMRDAWVGIGGTPEEAEGKSFDESIIDRYRALEARLAASEAARKQLEAERDKWQGVAEREFRDRRAEIDARRRANGRAWMLGAERDTAEIRATNANTRNLQLQAQLAAAIAARDELREGLAEAVPWLSRDFNLASRKARQDRETFWRAWLDRVVALLARYAEAASAPDVAAT